MNLPIQPGVQRNPFCPWKGHQDKGLQTQADPCFWRHGIRVGGVPQEVHDGFQGKRDGGE